MSLFKLTPELLHAVAIELRLVNEGQSSLASLARTNKTLNIICSSLLYQQPLIEDHESFGQWMKTIKKWSSQRQLPRMLELTVEQISRPSSAKCTKCDDQGHKTEHHSGSFYVLLKLVPLYHFHQLRALSIFNSEVPAESLARLLGPLTPLRQTIQDLALVDCGLKQKDIYAYLLLHLHFIVTSTVTDTRSNAQLGPSNPTRQAAVSDWQQFQYLKIEPT